MNGVSYRKKVKKLPAKKSRYGEINLPAVHIIKIGNSLGIVIPKDIIRNFHLKKGDIVVPTLVFRQWSLTDEMTEKELLEFQQWRREKRIEDEAILKAMHKMEID